MSTDLCDLPQELQIAILSNLDAVSLLRCAMTCTSIHATVRGSPLLEYAIELHRDGLKDAGTSLSYPDRIASLRRRRQAWRSFEIKAPLIHSTQHNYDAFDLVGGAYADISKDHYELLRLPTAGNITAHKLRLRRPAIGISPVNFTLDPTQDLMVILEEDDMNNPQTLHIHSLSTNTVHPRAQHSPLRWTTKPRMHMNALNLNRPGLQIAHDMVAVLFPYTMGETHVMVWDWTTSELLLDTSEDTDPALRAEIHDFRLLDSTYFLITCCADLGSLRLYKFVRAPLPDTAAAAHATHIATLHLPPTAPSVNIHAILSDAGPVEAHPRPDAPFALHADARVHLFTVLYDHDHAGADPHVRDHSFLNLCVHQRLLVGYAQRALAHDSPLEFSWAEWGPRNTRLAYSPHQHLPRNGRRHIHGQRVIFPDGEIGGVSRAATILDFSRAAVSSYTHSSTRMQQQQQDARAGPGPAASSSLMQDALVRSSTIFRADRAIFREDVKTYLPCVASHVWLGRSYETYMIYADGFVGANVNPPDNNLRLAIYPI